MGSVSVQYQITGSFLISASLFQSVESVIPSKYEQSLQGGCMSNIYRNKSNVRWRRPELPACPRCIAGRSRSFRSIDAGNGFGQLWSCRRSTSDSAGWLQVLLDSLVMTEFDSPRLPRLFRLSHRGLDRRKKPKHDTVMENSIVQQHSCVCTKKNLTFLVGQSGYKVGPAVGCARHQLEPHRIGGTDHRRRYNWTAITSN